jgi:FkbH-like protein
MELAGARNSHNPKLWYMGKIGFGNEVFREAARDVKAALRGIAGLARKLIILDLDDTLWGGVVGDVGWEGIRLGGHDPVGEAFGDFQAQLKALRNRGVLLGIVSKNEESAAVEAITRNPEMRLRLDDFAGWRINWSDKVSNIRALALELNLGLQSVVFIDDNPVERSRVREALPELLVPEWPDDKLLYGKALLDLDCFDVPTISEEDLQRTQLYAAERKRQAIREEVKSFDEWLPTLGMKVIVERLSPSNLPRTAQLLNKTNQMNLSTRRMTEGELATWADQDNHWVWTFRVADRFGDSGLTGIVSIVREGSSATIADFVLSCRVMGRRVEETMLHFVAGATRQLGMKQLKATYAPTARNKVCLTFWKECSGFEVGADGESFTLRLETSYPLPKGVELIAEDAS